jgi:adenosylcobinamide kinase / adenosylcobinamide-phosphate guanylyltransferase
MILGGRSVLPDRDGPSSASLLPRVTFVLGGARSGKSRYAESLIEAAAESGLYLATAEARDDEMRQRIRHHRARRGPRWSTIEAPLEIVPPLRREARVSRPILVDCLTLWLANVLDAGREVEPACAALLETIAALDGPVVVVANEVGLGIVPENSLARAFRDHAGRLNQAIAARADRVVFVAAGLPLLLKDAK